MKRFRKGKIYKYIKNEKSYILYMEYIGNRQFRLILDTDKNIKERFKKDKIFGDDGIDYIVNSNIDEVRMEML